MENLHEKEFITKISSYPKYGREILDSYVLVITNEVKKPFCFTFVENSGLQEDVKKYCYKVFKIFYPGCPIISN